jgi:hypothetical protein
VRMSNQPASRPETAPHSTRRRGFGTVLIAVYGLLALAATGRSVYQIASDFERAPLPYTLTAIAALVYIIATVALIRPGDFSYRLAWATISFELAGVLVVGTLSIVDPGLFPDHVKTVWTRFGAGYGYVPLILPVLGMIWLARNRPRLVAPPRVAVED